MPFAAHADLFQHAPGANVARIALGPDAVQVEFAESEVHHSARGFGGDPLAPGIRVEGVPEHRLALVGIGDGKAAASNHALFVREHDRQVVGVAGIFSGTCDGPEHVAAALFRRARVEVLVERHLRQRFHRVQGRPILFAELAQHQALRAQLNHRSAHSPAISRMAAQKRSISASSL